MKCIIGFVSIKIVISPVAKMNIHYYIIFVHTNAGKNVFSLQRSEIDQRFHLGCNWIRLNSDVFRPFVHPFLFIISKGVNDWAKSGWFMSLLWCHIIYGLSDISSIFSKSATSLPATLSNSHWHDDVIVSWCHIILRSKCCPIHEI